MQERAESWLRVLATALLVPLIIVILSNYFIPSIIEKSNKREALRAARLKKSLDVGDHNKDFTTQLHRLKTMMQMFNGLNIRRKLSEAQLRGAQDAFQKEYTNQYLALDETAWWWYGELQRDAETYDLLSPDEEKKLVELTQKYGDNVTAAVGTVGPLWSYLSSSEYSLREDKNQFGTLESKMNTDLTRLYDDRVQLVREISKLFAQSQYEPEH